MESRVFIRQSGVLTNKINKLKLEVGPSEERDREREVVQKELNQLFQGLQNPSLPSASRLATLAAENGFTLETKVRHRIEQAESFWS